MKEQSNVSKQLESATLANDAKKNLEFFLDELDSLGYSTGTLRQAVTAYVNATAVMLAETAFFNMSISLSPTADDARRVTSWLSSEIEKRNKYTN